MRLNSIYVTVENMERALDFYEKFFQMEPEHVEDRYSVFELGEVSFGLYNPEVDGEKAVLGNNCVPDFEVDNIEAEYERIQKLTDTIDDSIQTYGGMSLFQLEDSEGNVLEVYAQS